MDITNIPLIAAVTGLLGLVIAYGLYLRVNSVKIDNKTVADITEEIQDGAMAFLQAEYKILGIFVAVVGALLFVLNDVETTLAFFAGALASVAAGFSGMKAATSANGRTAMAAKNGGQSAALAVSYNGGAVMGLSVVDLVCSVSHWLLTGWVLVTQLGQAMMRLLVV
jgi:K(+)-stimulated pyrophosphate-energized sodium pump